MLNRTFKKVNVNLCSGGHVTTDNFITQLIKLQFGHRVIWILEDEILYIHMYLTTPTRFNTIAIQAAGPDGKWTMKPLAYQEFKIVNLYTIHPPKICVNLVFKHIHAAN